MAVCLQLFKQIMNLSRIRFLPKRCYRINRSQNLVVEHLLAKQRFFTLTALLAFMQVPGELLAESKNLWISGRMLPANEEKTKEHLQFKIAGTVTDFNGRPLMGVTVAEIGKKNTGISDKDGRFELTVSNAAVRLRFSFVGFVTIEREVNANMVVRLASSEKNIDEVVVTGFQKIDKSKFTGSVSNVDKKNIDRSGAMDVSRLLQGAAAGVSVQNTSGTFGTTPKIRIRGNSSISANQEPLYVINGVPITAPSNVAVSQLYTGDPASVLSSAIAGLNAQDIEDIQILKDGAATALYGVRASNGVISITTKKGNFNSRNINISTALSIGVKPNIGAFNLMNSQQEIDLYRNLYDRGYFSNSNWPSSTGAFTEAYRRLAFREYSLDEAYKELDKSALANTNWFDVLFRNNLIQEHSLSFSGGGDKHTYYVSGSYANDDGQAIGFGSQRYTTDARTIFNITPKFDLDVHLNWNARKQATPGTLNSSTIRGDLNRKFEINPFNYAMSTSRAMYPFQEDGTFKHYLENYAPFNILEELKENFSDIKAQEIRLILRPSYKIFKNLRFDGTYAIRRSNTRLSHVATERSNLANAYRVDYHDVLRELNETLYQDPSQEHAFPETILPDGGFRYLRNNDLSFWSLRNQISFSDTFGAHKIGLLAGIELERTYSDRIFTKTYGYEYYGGKIANPSRLAMTYALNMDDRMYIETFQDRRQIGYYTNLQYSFKNRYNVDLSVRQDGSNTSGRMQRTRFLPNYGVGLAWNIDKEKFFKRWSVAAHIDYIKLRVSHALRGNIFETSPMLNAAFLNMARLDATNTAKGINVSSPELFNLAWEKDYTTNFGLDFSLFNRFTLIAEYYSRRNKDLVIPFNVAQEDGFSSKRINFGTMTNRGVDLTLGYSDLLNNKILKWDINFIYGYVKNQLKEGELQAAQLTQITSPNGYGLVGYPLEGLYGYNFKSLSPAGQPTFLSESGEVSNVEPASRDRSMIRFLGSRQPISTGSISNSFQYKGLELRVFLTYSLGHKVFVQPVAARSQSDSDSKSGDLSYRYQTLGDHNHTNIPGLLSAIHARYLTSSFTIDELAYNRSDFRAADASNLRISEVLLAYDIGKILHRRYPSIKSARLMLSANNIHYWASGRLRGVDPDLYLTGGNSLPNPRSFTVRLTLGF